MITRELGVETIPFPCFTYYINEEYKTMINLLPDDIEDVVLRNGLHIPFDDLNRTHSSNKETLLGRYIERNYKDLSVFTDCVDEEVLACYVSGVYTQSFYLTDNHDLMIKQLADYYFPIMEQQYEDKRVSMLEEAIREYKRG